MRLPLDVVEWIERRATALAWEVREDRLVEPRSGVRVRRDLVLRPEDVPGSPEPFRIVGADFSVAWQLDLGRRSPAVVRQLFRDGIYSELDAEVNADLTVPCSLHAAVGYWYGGTSTLGFARNVVGDLMVLGMLTGSWENERSVIALDHFRTVRRSLGQITMR